MFCIGYFGDNYPEKRMIIDKVNKTNIEYRKVKNTEIKVNTYKALSKILPFIKNGDNYKYQVNFISNSRNTTDVIHSFNMLYKGKENWVCTFESMFPVIIFLNHSQKFFNNNKKYLLNNNLVKLLPMSKWAYDYSVENLSKYLSKTELETIINKMEIVHPSQKINITLEELESKKKYDCINFMFIGREFWRKGGFICLKVLEQIHQKYNIHLTLISDMQINPELYNPKDKNEKDSIIRFIRDNASWVKWYENLDNKLVMQKLREDIHIGLLPTYRDTYGFSLLEMQASGCPVISSNVNALSEINNDEIGWVIDLKKYIKGQNNNYYDEKTCQEIYDILTSQMYKIIDGILDNPDIIYEKAKKALINIEENHSTLEYENKMHDIYKSI